MKKTFILFVLIFCISSAICQDTKEIVQEKTSKAVELMDAGSTDEAIALLKEAKKLDPENCDIDYEIGFAYLLKEDYKTAISVLKKTLKCKDTYDIYYQLLGNAYDYSGSSKKALETYDDGLKLFPKSGKLYLEKGNVYWGKKEYNDALPYYEKGIEADPTFASNYFRASLLFFTSTEIVWAMIYGEIFINLERNTDRTSTISKLLYDSYKSQIEFTTDSTISVSFSKMNTITLDELTDSGGFKLPFAISAYEPSMLLSLINEKEISLESLARIRENFISNYINSDFNTKYPNVLFDYQKKIIDAGYMEPYTYWLLMDGDEEGFKKWKEKNMDKWDEFVSWYEEHPMELNEYNKFYRSQY
jgi:tetratricopeptide (TPR) repeat protein